MNEHPLFSKKHTNHVQQWGQTLPAQMKNSHPVPDDLQQEYILYLETSVSVQNSSPQHSVRLLFQLQQSDFHTDAQNLLLSLAHANPGKPQTTFMQKWREHLSSRVLSLEIAFAEQERERMLGKSWRCAMQVAGN